MAIEELEQRLRPAAPCAQMDIAQPDGAELRLTHDRILMAGAAPIDQPGQRQCDAVYLGRVGVSDNAQVSRDRPPLLGHITVPRCARGHCQIRARKSGHEESATRSLLEGVNAETRASTIQTETS